MNQGFLRSSIIAAVIAVVVWVVISLLVDMSTGAVISGAIVLGLIGLIGTYVISTIVARSKQ
jgi:hypothetical protein